MKTLIHSEYSFDAIVDKATNISHMKISLTSYPYETVLVPACDVTVDAAFDIKTLHVDAYVNDVTCDDCLDIIVSSHTRITK